MTFTAQVKVMPLKELLDPQGKAVLGGCKNLGLSAISDVRIGKNISLQIEADTAENAKQIARTRNKDIEFNAKALGRKDAEGFGAVDFAEKVSMEDDPQIDLSIL